MLNTLIVRNFVLIDKLVLDFKSGFTAITGETGAGKSILLGAIGLLMGQRADSSSVRPGSDKCIIEAHFDSINDAILKILEEEDIDIDNDALIIRREISTRGKSRAFVNDTPTSLTTLKALSEHLIDIHSQHKNLLLGDAHFQLSVLDLYDNLTPLLNRYTACYNEYKSIAKALDAAKEAAIELAKEEDYLSFQYNQLEEAHLRKGELKSIEDEGHMLSHALDIKSGLDRAHSALDNDEQGTIQTITTAIDSLHTIQRYYSEAEHLIDRLKSLKIDIRDISATLEQEQERIEYDPERLQVVEQRLDLLNSLLSKHGVQTIEELIDVRDQIASRLESINSSDEHIKELKNRLELVHEQTKKLADELHEKRMRAAQAIESSLIAQVKELGIPYLQFHIDIQKSNNLNTTGCTLVTYLFSANKDIEPEPVADIASGGEISRLMLSIKSLIADRRSLPTIIFDEIDTGVSGDIADKIGTILQSMGESMQVMAVTHLPQIAAAGGHHIYIYKEHGEDSTLSHIKYLEPAERIEEIARMQSGNNLNSITRAAAQELLTKNHNKQPK